MNCNPWNFREARKIFSAVFLSAERGIHNAPEMRQFSLQSRAIILRVICSLKTNKDGNYNIQWVPFMPFFCSVMLECKRSHACETDDASHIGHVCQALLMLREGSFGHLCTRFVSRDAMIEFVPEFVRSFVGNA